MSAGQQFTPPFEEHIDDTLALLVPAAEVDARGGVTAQVELWNGTVLFTDRVRLASAKAREQYTQRIAPHLVGAAADAEARARLVDAALIRLAVGLPAAIGDTAAAPAAPAADPAVLWDAARELAEAPDLLDRVADTLAALGLVGEERNGKLVYLAATARLLEELVHIIVKGPSSVGKSYLLKQVLRLLPPSVYVDYTSVSPKYLAYCEDDLRHRIVVLYEAGGIAEGMGAYVMRSLLSEGRLNCGTVDKAEGGANAARQLVKEGPTALFTSTTRAAVDAELETRLVSVSVTDTPAHSRAIVEGQARAAEGEARTIPDLAPFHALQEWLAVAGARTVRVPFARALGGLVPHHTLRIRRDFPKLLSLIEACALLHQAQRVTDSDGVVLASLEDYAIVRDLLAEAFSAAQQDGLTPAQREAIAAVAVLCEAAGASDAGVSLKRVAAHLGLDKSAASRRLANPLEHGYVRNLNVDGQGKPVRGKPAAYVLGEALPPEVTALPTREAVAEELTKVVAPCNGATLQQSRESPAPAPDTGVAGSVAHSVSTATVEGAAVESVAVEDRPATVAATPNDGAGIGETDDPLQCCSVADPYEGIQRHYPCTGCDQFIPIDGDCPRCDAGQEHLADAVHGVGVPARETTGGGGQT